MKKLTETILIFMAGLFFIAVLAVLMSYPIMWLWNSCLVPAIDGVNEITVIQALGLNILTWIMFVTRSTPKNND